jgi:hypothetical protein
MACELQEVRRNQQRMQEKLSSLAVSPKQGEVDAENKENQAAEARDRKRFKERLKKEAFKAMHMEAPSWLEYLFGICQGDKRMGKDGSRYLRFGFCVCPEFIIIIQHGISQ